MARAAAQMLGVLATVEGVRFGRRIPGLLKTLLPALQRAAQEACCLTKSLSPHVSQLSRCCIINKEIPSRDKVLNMQELLRSRC